MAKRFDINCEKLKAVKCNTVMIETHDGAYIDVDDYHKCVARLIELNGEKRTWVQMMQYGASVSTDRCERELERCDQEFQKWSKELGNG